MSVLSREKEAVGLGLAQFPRVNLMPPEIEERRQFRRVQIGLGAAVVATVGMVGVLYAAASGSLSDAEEELATANARGASLKAETAKYRDVTAVYQRASAAEALLTQAMGEEVRYSKFLNDLSLTVPDNVWVKSLSFAQTPTQPVVGSTQPGIGTVTVSGVGFSHDDVAVWLESLARQKGYANPFFSSSTEALIGPRKVVEFTSTATITPGALSGRYTKPAGG